MPRVRITEHKAKQLLLGDTYKGVALTLASTDLPTGGRWVLKVDQGIKKRFKQGLVAVDVAPDSFVTKMGEWTGRGFTNFLAEPFVEHSSADERYLSLERVRDGIRLLFAIDGGVDVEAHPEAMQSFVVHTDADIPLIAQATGLPIDLLTHLLQAFNTNFFSFLEINPLVIKNDIAHLLDAAVLVDNAGAFFVHGAWTEADLIASQTNTAAEEHVRTLQQSTPASLKLTVMNPNGSLFFLLSGGGGSIVIADEAAAQGMSDQIGNYGEYSGGPSREETHLYAREVISLLLASTAPKKALIIAGGVANFTDVATTFDGLIDALSEKADALRSAEVRVFVRRGGPNEARGLERMRTFLTNENLLGSVHGSEAVITQAVSDAVTYSKQL